MVAVQIRLALGAVDDQLVHLADAAAHLEVGREHGAAHADHAGLAHAVQDGIRVLQLLRRQRLEILAGGVLKVVLDDDGHNGISKGMRPRLDGNHLAGDRGVDRCGYRCRIVSHDLAHFDIVAHLDHRIAGSADMLGHRDNHLCRGRDYRDRHVRCLPVVGMHAALKRMGHKLHLEK